MGKLDGKNVVVTGASRGIGSDISKLFALEGANVICAARTMSEGDHPLEGSLNKTVSDIKTQGGEATAVAVNISLEEVFKGRKVNYSLAVLKKRMVEEGYWTEDCHI